MDWEWKNEFTVGALTSFPNFETDEYLLEWRHECYKDFLLYRKGTRDIWRFNWQIMFEHGIDEPTKYAEHLIANVPPQSPTDMASYLDVGYLYEKGVI